MALPPQVLGPLIGGGISALGSVFTNRRNISHAKSAAAADRQWQEHLLKNQIQWRMQDAKAAGVAPGVALGGSVVGSGTSTPVPQMQNELHAMGQGVGRALSSGLTPFQQKQQQLTLENMALQNEQLRTQIAGSKMAVVNQPGMPKPFPSHLSDNQPTGDIITSRLPPSASSVDKLVGDVERALAATPKIVRDEIVGSSPDNPLRTAGHKAPVSYLRTSDGFQLVPSKDAKELIEDSLWDEMSWRANVMRDPYKFAPPSTKYFHWSFNPLTLTFKKIRKGERRFQYRHLNPFRRY